MRNADIGKPRQSDIRDKLGYGFASVTIPHTGGYVGKTGRKDITRSIVQ